MYFAVEVAALVIELKNLGVLREDRELAVHELGVAANKLVEDLPVLLSEFEEECLQASRWRRSTDCAW